jgi:hypothetical protein
MVLQDFEDACEALALSIGVAYGPVVVIVQLVCFPSSRRVLREEIDRLRSTWQATVTGVQDVLNDAEPEIEGQSMSSEVAHSKVRYNRSSSSQFSEQSTSSLQLSEQLLPNGPNVEHQRTKSLSFDFSNMAQSDMAQNDCVNFDADGIERALSLPAKIGEAGEIAPTSEQIAEGHAYDMEPDSGLLQPPPVLYRGKRKTSKVRFWAKWTGGGAGGRQADTIEAGRETGFFRNALKKKGTRAQISKASLVESGGLHVTFNFQPESTNQDKCSQGWRHGRELIIKENRSRQVNARNFPLRPSNTKPQLLPPSRPKSIQNGWIPFHKRNGTRTSKGNRIRDGKQ